MVVQASMEMGSSITYTDFQATLRAVVEQRSQQYQNIYSIAVRWELDDTNAELDTAHFQSMLKNFDTDPAEVLVLGSDDDYPVYTLSRAWLNFTAKARLNNERNLIIFHYAGHGTTKNGSFNIAENMSEESKTANFERAILADVKDPKGFSDIIDILFILDCCYAHYTTRAPKTTRNVIEILAATSSQTVTARFAPNNTFTAKLANEIARRKKAHHESVEFTSVFQSLLTRSSTIVRPTHALLVGAASVNIPLNGYRTVDPRTIPADYNALFAVNISRDIIKEELKELSTWMRKLPSFAGLKIENIYHTQSMCLIMRASFSVYTKLHNMQGYNLIAENPGPALTHLLQPELSEEPASPPSQRSMMSERR
ncbi:uncharacterized protein BO87DRAFT_373792 [Aspergillus neoniger CBS 115656]|uniref:Uncharacterized protein n=1 Tax=Aspergillus neoniger (strain CBS 115656) TaxID=1448310 RepID=A0A318YRT7_ASPNB|nr:hypothetical protein BO87DRAFT_373792 [Aspergillus neoniger CBS 115656]PYH37405.1 hypothetical protein BO87DRAFT_373792 [Aspergillus neoniger CBS 115656]